MNNNQKRTAGRLVLGTAQLGSDYGIANSNGKPGPEMAEAIVHEAWEQGITTFDTAQCYGTSENVLGTALQKLGINDKAEVISKFHPDLDHLDEHILSRALDDSLQRLHVPILTCIMLHRQEMLSLWDRGLGDILGGLVSSGRVRHIGISVYSPAMAAQALNRDGIDYVQLPSNILDRRFERAGVFELARKKKKTIHVRSIFLQGLLLLTHRDIPDRMSFAAPVMSAFDKLSDDLGLSRKALAMGYMKEAFPETQILFGAETATQVRENCMEWERLPSLPSLEKIRALFDDVDEKVLNPAQWNR